MGCMARRDAIKFVVCFNSFVSAGVGLGARHNIWLGARLHHISNSRLYTRNSGANIGVLELGMRSRV